MRKHAVGGRGARKAEQLSRHTLKPQQVTMEVKLQNPSMTRAWSGMQLRFSRATKYKESIPAWRLGLGRRFSFNLNSVCDLRHIWWTLWAGVRFRNCGLLRVGAAERRWGPGVLRLGVFIRFSILPRPEPCQPFAGLPQPVSCPVISGSWGHLLYSAVGKISPTEGLNALLQSAV